MVELYRKIFFCPTDEDDLGGRGGRSERGGRLSVNEAYIPYLDNIETTLMKIFVKSPIKSARRTLFLLNGLLSLFGSILGYDRILRLVKKERWGSLFGVKSKNKE